MCKRLSAFLAALMLMICLALPVGAEEAETPQQMQYTIYSRNVFLEFAEKCRLDSFSKDLHVSLRCDLDLTDMEFTGIPIFCGTFEGNGHTIRGLQITGAGSNQGLFRYLTETARVQNLHVSGSVSPEGSRSQVGGIAGSNAGVIANCSFGGTVSGSDSVGAIVGSNAITGIVENCTASGNVSGIHFVGGIAGSNSGVIRSCTNDAKINETPQQNTVELTDITLESVTNSEAANTVTDIGGIAGSSMGLIRDCINRGDVGYRHMGYNIGGIAGTQSGAVISCENHASIHGRKEVGGIVGQMEPTALIAYSEDALQILKRQLTSMGTVINETVSSVQNTGDAIAGQVWHLQNHVLNARDAVETLIPDKENPELPDLDTIQAAHNTISSSISGMSQTLDGMSATTYSAMGALSNNLHALQNQINAMRTTLGNVSETLGGSISDVSDLDSEEDFTGKVAQCTNYGAILADRNAGGIAGAMAMENDLDHEDDWSIAGDSSLNFESELRAVIVSCSNAAKVTCGKQNAGGIVGWQSMGLVKNCVNSGTLDAVGAEYVGGVTGQSLGYIRQSHAKCEIAGSRFVGGIAGSAVIVTDCRSLVKLTDTKENTGAILGQLEQTRLEEENPVSGNVYFPISADIGGIDGISYDGQAQAMDRESFLALENLPDLFRHAAIRFRYSNGLERFFVVPLGESFSQQWVPPIPPRAGYVSCWDGLTEELLEEVLFDMTFTIRQTGKRTVLQSENLDGTQPVMLLQGVFNEDAVLTLEEIHPELPLEKKQSQILAWQLNLTGADTVTGLRLRIPEGMEEAQFQIRILGSGGTWRTVQPDTDSSYLTTALTMSDSAVALIRMQQTPWLIIAGGIGAAMLLVLTVLIKKRKKTA